MAWTGLDEDIPIENRLVTKSIAGAQVKVESYHFDIRKHLLDFDDVLSQQRNIIYNDRHDILDGINLKAKILGMIRQEFEDLILKHLPGRHSDDWDAPGFLNELGLICPLPAELANQDQVYQQSLEQIRQELSDHAEKVYQDREEEIGADQMRTLERLLLLRAIDTHWVSHLTGMENLRTGIGLHAYGQRDPLVAYRTEGHKMFQELLSRMQYDVVHTLFHVTITQEAVNGGRKARGAAATKASPMQAVNRPHREAVGVGAGKIGRNERCPCGSGKKYKRCCGANV